MVSVALSLGSNIRRYFYINRALDALEQTFGDILVSPVYESAAVGFNGSPFLNLIVIVETSQSLMAVIKNLKQIENDNGRDRSRPKFAARTIDIDVVTYGDLAGEVDGISLPRPELFANAFVLLPLVDLWADKPVPGLALNFSQLWQRQGDQGQQLMRVFFRRQVGL